jgi:hypothetical protein
MQYKPLKKEILKRRFYPYLLGMILFLTSVWLYYLFIRPIYFFYQIENKDPVFSVGIPYYRFSAHKPIVIESPWTPYFIKGHAIEPPSNASIFGTTDGVNLCLTVSRNHGFWETKHLELDSLDRIFVGGTSGKNRYKNWTNLLRNYCESNICEARNDSLDIYFFLTAEGDTLCTEQKPLMWKKIK